MVQNPCGRTITAARWEILQRFGIERLRHAMRYSGQKEGLCVGGVQTGWLAGIGKIMGADAREIADAEVVVIWGGNPVNTQINS